MAFFFATTSNTNNAQENIENKKQRKSNSYWSQGPVCTRVGDLLVFEHNGKLVIVQHHVVYVSSNRLSQRRHIQRGAAASRADNRTQKDQTAHAGRDIYQINYYGAEYSSAHPQAATTMDPEKFTKPVVDLASKVGPALASPTVEEAGYSDRLSQLTAGNSTITTQEAASAIVAYGKWPEYTQGVGESIDRQTQPGPAVDRFYTLDSVVWSNSTKGWFYNLPGCLADLGVFGQNCAFHFLMRSGFCVHVQVNASAFHQGMLLVAAIPECQSSSGERSNPSGTLSDLDFADYPIAQLTLFPHQLINLRTNNSATIVLPYMNASPSENALSHDYWTLFVVPITPLSFNAGATTTIPITLSIAPMKAQFSGLRNSVPISTYAIEQGIATFDVPGSGQFVTTIRNAGFPALPDFEETPLHEIPGEVTNLLEVMQVDTFCQVSSSGNYLNLDVSNPGAGNKIASWDLSLDSNFLSTTYLSRVTRWFSNYRGSINLTFMFCGSKMATGKILLAYTPPGGEAPASRKDAMLATHMVWDLGLQSACTFTIPWISQTAYRLAHVEGNVLSYRGYVTVFYQTHIVVPPGAPQTCQIVVLASAAQDFVCRVPTDNAYFQGLKNEIKDAVQSSIQTKPVTLEIPAVAGPSVPSNLSVQTGDAPALTAPETGASATTEASTTMETRDLATKFSARETQISNFMSKYALFHKGYIQSGTTTDASNMLKIPLYFSDDATQKAVRSKYRMFTYVRCAYDVNVVLSATGDTQGTPKPIPMVQMIYCPPGCPTPTDASSALWYLPTTPSVFQVANSTISLRIPYMGAASAYASFYNGYENFNPAAAGYGKFPGNFIGTLCFRFAQNGVSANSSKTLLTILSYARPTNVRVWGPRPIVTLKSRSALYVSRGRVLCVPEEDECEEVLEQQPDGTERRRPVNLGPRACVPSKPGYRTTISRAPEHVQFYFDQCYLAKHKEDNNTYHIFPLSTTRALMPVHLYRDEGMLFKKNQVDKSFKVRYRLVWSDFTMDLCCIELDTPFFETVVPVCVSCCRERTWTAIHTSMFNFAMYCGQAVRIGDRTVYADDDDEIGHVQRELLEVKAPIMSGHCGSPLICEHGICGMATAGDGETSWFTEFFLADEISSDVQGPVEEQGIRSYCANIARDMGAAFSSSSMDNIASRMQKAVEGVVLDKVNVKSVVVKKIIQLVVKLITIITMIARSDNKLETAAGLGVLLGIDLLTMDPFKWLEDKVMDLLGYKHRRIPQSRSASQQGMVEWIKDFNAACSAAKGLEWIGEKLLKFWDWLKALFKKEEPLRRRFNRRLEEFPLMMEHMDKIMAARGKYPDEQVLSVCNAIRDLKRLADVYGVERNAATAQIVKYYGKAMSVLQSMTKGRVEPVGLLVHGTPGTGKSLATEVLGRFLCSHLGSARPYSLPPDPKHFDGYAQQPVVIMDDLGQNPDGEDCKLLCQMISSTEFIVPMAALEEKGMAFTSPFVLASTNCQELRPPTVMEPKALKRRFFLDLHIEVQKDYDKKGKLDADSALTQCTTTHCVNFKRCCPLICGKAILLVDKDLGIKYSLDDVASMILREFQARRGCGNKLEALFQGKFDDDLFIPSLDVDESGDEDSGFGPNDWLETDYDRLPNVLKTYEEMKTEGISLPCPREIADLVRAVPDPKVLSYCREQGWLIPAEVERVIVCDDVRKMVDWISVGLAILSSVISLVGFVYLMYKIFATCQGPYNGNAQPVMKKPELRRTAVAQGPDMEFVNKLFKQSLFDVETTHGHFTGLGLYGKWILLPKHAYPDVSIEMDGVGYDIVEVVELECKNGPLELTAVKIDRPVDFRDIRKYIPDHFVKEKDCYLAVNNEYFPRMFCPVGVVSMFGFLNLSHRPTYNTCTYPYPSRTGQCGGVIVKAGKILAMHIGGDGCNGYGAILTKRIIAVLEQGEMTSMAKSDVSINVNTRSSLHPSIFYHVFPGEKEPAALSTHDKRLEVDLEKALFSKYKGNVEVQVPCGQELPENMLVAVEHYTEQIRPLMPRNLQEELTLEEVVYGIEKLDGLDLATSAGYPYCVKGIRKKDLIPPNGEPLTKLQEALDLHGYDLPFTTYIKDELRPKAKVKAGKSRLIECSSLNDTIRMKKVFGRLFQVFHSNPGVATGSAVGCNPDVDWSRFYAEMGEQPLIAFDYSNFDASLHPLWFKALSLVLSKLGYSEDSLKCIDHITFSTHLYKDKIYTVEGGMPSGCSGTSVFNSIINNIILRTLILDVYKHIDLDMFKMIAYGDDVVAVYPYQLDASELARAGAVYGLQMTPPDKESDFSQTSWSNVTFLKRRFVPDEEFPFLVHPVFPMKEIHESIRWTRSAATTQDHVHSLCLLAWHNGEDVYNEFVGKIRSTPIGRVLKLPSYLVLRKAWLDMF
uniref:Genome polyprotein n=1 Tax=Miniopterus bat picornavirus TaxID=3141889 RepID=A0AAU7E2B7_9VIRU